MIQPSKSATAKREGEVKDNFETALPAAWAVILAVLFLIAVLWPELVGCIPEIGRAESCPFNQGT